MQIDVFTPLPHAFAWMTEQRPVATVLGTELDLRLWNYRDFTRLTGGQDSHMLSSMLGADALARIDPGEGEAGQGERVEIELL